MSRWRPPARLGRWLRARLPGPPPDAKHSTRTRQALAAGASVLAVAAVGWGTALLAGAPGPGVETSRPAITPSPTRSTVAPPDPADVEALKKLALPSPAASPSPTETGTTASEPSYPVAEVQQQLKDLRYYRGPVDGEEGAATTHAVMAFQKVQGLAVDGVVGPGTLEALKSPRQPELRSGPDTRIEIDLSRQVLYWVEGGELDQIFPVSSGSGDAYTTSSGSTAYSLTPEGWFEIERRISGIRDAPLGILYDPLYFYKGWAVHGSNSVPAHPASHGCVRLPRADARWLFDRAPNGTPVHLYGGEHTFPAGSDAPGTDTPAGDTTQQSPEPEPSNKPTPSNGSPKANEDTATVEAGRRTLINVLGNDSDDQKLTAAKLSVANGPEGGSATVEGSKIRYTAPDRAGTFAFAYRLCDPHGACATAQVTVTVTKPTPQPTTTASTTAAPDSGG